MKKILTFLFTVLIMSSLMAQRPVNTRARVATQQPNAAVQVDRNNNLCTGARSSQTFYIIDEMSIPNVTVIDATVTLTVQSNDKLKVTQTTDYDVSYYIYDANNQAITKNCIRNQYGSIDFKPYQPGEYRVQIIDRKGAEKNFKVVKKQK